MKIMLISLFVILFGLGVKAQTLIDPNLQLYARQDLIDGIKDFGDNVNQAGVVISFHRIWNSSQNEVFIYSCCRNSKCKSSRCHKL